MDATSPSLFRGQARRLYAMKEPVYLVRRLLVGEESEHERISRSRDHGNILPEAILHGAFELGEELGSQGDEGQLLPVVMELGGSSRNAYEEHEEVARTASDRFRAARGEALDIAHADVGILLGDDEFYPQGAGLDDAGGMGPAPACAFASAAPDCAAAGARRPDASASKATVRSASAFLSARRAAALSSMALSLPPFTAAADPALCADSAFASRAASASRAEVRAASSLRLAAMSSADRDEEAARSSSPADELAAAAPRAAFAVSAAPEDALATTAGRGGLDAAVDAVAEPYAASVPSTAAAMGASARLRHAPEHDNDAEQGREAQEEDEGEKRHTRSRPQQGRKRAAL